MKAKVFVVLALLLLLTTTATQISQASNPESPLQQQGGAGSTSSVTATMGAGTPIHFDMSATPPELTPAQKTLLEEHERNRPFRAASPLPVGTTAVQRPDSALDANSQTRGPLPGEADRSLAPTAPGTFDLYRNAYMGATIKANTSGNTGEPNAGNSGPIVFATGNWWGAVSSNGGQTFSYINPATFFPSKFGGFCCDQHTLYDPSRDIFIWYLQYISSGPAGAGQNTFRVAVARPSDALNGFWWYWDFDSASNTEWDYPDLCLSNNFVYITTNRGTYNSGSVNRAFMFRIPLDPISVGAGFGYGFLDLGTIPLSNLSLKCTHGAREVMYFGSHNSTSQIRIFSWADNSGTIYWNQVNLSVAWPNAVRVCQTPDNRNWCGFDDGRMKTGLMASERVGRFVEFMWNASAGGTTNCGGGACAHPYVETARVLVTDPSDPPSYTYLDRQPIYNSAGSFQYPAAAPNARGDVGITAYYSDASFDPYFFVGIDDDYHRFSGGWDVRYVRASTQGPADQTQQRWGDYFEVQPFAPTDLGWITIGQTLQGCGIAGCKESNYVIFGRDRDLRSVQKYFNPNFGLALPLIVR